MVIQSEIKFLQAPENLGNETIKPCNYLIQKVQQDYYFVHRELEEDEQHRYHYLDTFKLNDKTYVWGIAVWPTEETAELAIISYWDKIKKTIEKMKHF